MRKLLDLYKENEKVIQLLSWNSSIATVSEKLSLPYENVRSRVRTMKRCGLLDKGGQLVYTLKELEALSKGKSIELNADNVIAFLRRGRTKKDILDHFSVTDVNKVIKVAQSAFGDIYSISKTRSTTNNEEIWIAIPKSTDFAWKKNVKARIFQVVKSPNNVPYIWVNLDTKLMNEEKIKIVPISDLHYGSVEYDEKKFLEYIDWIEKTPNVISWLNGDIIENSTKQSIADGVYRQFASPMEQVSGIVKHLSRIQHKLICSVRGNHEKRTTQLGLDPGKFIADYLEIPYFVEPVYIDIPYGEEVFSIRADHGGGGGATKPAMIAKAAKPASFTDFTHFYVSGHVHNKVIVQDTRLVKNRQTFDLEEKKQFIVICPSFVTYFNSYAAEAGYMPPSTGAIALEIYKNGDYHVSG